MSADREQEDRDHLPELEGLATEAEVRAAARSAAESEADGPHPEAEDLVAYQEGRLPESRADAVRRHLAGCPECASLVLDYAAFPALEPPEGRELLDPSEVEAARRRFDAEHPPLAVPGVGGRSPGGYRLLALAASIACVLALGWGVMQMQTIGALREEVASLRGGGESGEDRLHLADVESRDLFDVYRGEEPLRFVVGEGGDAVLRLGSPPGATAWDATVRTAEGELVGREANVRPNADGDLVFVVDRPQTGFYELELRPVGSDGEVVVTPFTVARPEPGEGDGSGDSPGGSDP